MMCPRCGLSIESMAAPWCPRCGQPLQLPAQIPAAVNQIPGANLDPSNSDAVQPYPVYAPPVPPGTQPGEYPSYHAPVYPPGYGAAYAPPAPPTYGPNYGTSMTPIPPGYVPPWGLPGMPPPPAPPRKRPSALLIGGIVALAVVLIATIAGGSAFVLHQRASSQTPALPVVTPTVTPVMPGMNGRTVLVYDSLLGDATDWPDDGTHCFVRSDGYHITHDYFCYPGNANVVSATISVRAELVAGSLDTLYGIAFRIVNQPKHFAFYFFGVSADGSWTFQLDDDGNWTPLVAPQPSAAVQVGPHAFTTLTVSATGPHFDFYIGRTQVGSANDSTLTGGDTGLATTGAGEAAFTTFVVAT